jgi:hypothetical protein
MRMENMKNAQGIVSSGSFGPKAEDVSGGWREFISRESHNSYYSLIIKETESYCVSVRQLTRDSLHFYDRH